MSSVSSSEEHNNASSASYDPRVEMSIASTSKSRKNRDKNEFSIEVRVDIAQSCDYRCCNPACGRSTRIPSRVNRYVEIGVLAHINSAGIGKEGGKPAPRYDPNATPQYLRSRDNAIWLCKTCEITVDSDWQYYTKEMLQQWKLGAENYVAGLSSKNFWALQPADDEKSDSADKKESIVDATVNGIAIQRIRDFGFAYTGWMSGGPPPVEEILRLRLYLGDTTNPYGDSVIHELLDVLYSLSLPDADQKRALVEVIELLLHIYATGKAHVDKRQSEDLIFKVLSTAANAVFNVGFAIDFKNGSESLPLVNNCVAIIMAVKVRVEDRLENDPDNQLMQSLLTDIKERMIDGLLKRMKRADRSADYLNNWMDLVYKRARGGRVLEFDTEQKILALPPFLGLELSWI